MDLELAGKRAVVTGGSRGIGKAIARALAAEGVDLVIAARNREPLEAAAGELREASGQRVFPVVADTGRRDSVEALVATAVERLGGVDILVNNAATAGGVSPATRLADVDDEAVLQDVNVKVVGYLRTARAVAPLLVAQGWGRIINIGGVAAFRSGRPVTSLRNVAVAALTKNLADELGPSGVTVNAVHPGVTRTERTTEAIARQAAGSAAIGRIVDASEVAHLVAFLASPRSVAVNGESIAAGGGIPGQIRY